MTGGQAQSSTSNGMFSEGARSMQVKLNILASFASLGSEADDKEL